MRDFAHPCSTIVAAQHVPERNFHLPEPWNGAIEAAPILFVSWNPSWNPNERFPTRDWSDGEIIAFFRRRFQHSDQRSQTWREMRRIAEHLLQRPPTAGLDYAVMDVVRCKSRKGEGRGGRSQSVPAATSTEHSCLREQRSWSAWAKDARETLARYAGVAAEIGAHSPVALGSRGRMLVMLGAAGSAQPVGRRRLQRARLHRGSALVRVLAGRCNGDHKKRQLEPIFTDDPQCNGA